MQKVLEPIQRVRFTKSTLRHASILEKKKTIVGKISVKAPISEVPTLQNSRIGPTKRLTDKSDVPKSKAWNLVKNIYKLKEKDKATFDFPAVKWVLPAASTKEAGEKRVCSRFRSKYAYGE